MKIFRLIFILALGLQIGFGADENGSSGSGQNVGNANDDYKYYLKYQSKTIVNEGECQKCDDVKDGFVAIQYHYDDMTGTTYCNVYKNTDWNNPIGTAHRQVKSCSYYNSESAKEAQNIIQKMSETNKKSADIISSIGSKDNKFTDNSNGITFTEFLVGLITLNPNFINRNSIAGENFLKQTLNSNVYTSASNDMNVIQSVIDSGKKTLDGVQNDKNNNSTITIVDKRGIALSASSSNALDGFNKNNMVYFNNLFTSMEKIYQHLQVFIFVLIGGFFVMQIGASKATSIFRK